MSSELRVDWPRCRGRGLCHEMLPEAVALDEWGFPIVTALPPGLVPEARAAARACPHAALWVADRDG